MKSEMGGIFCYNCHRSSNHFVSMAENETKPSERQNGFCPAPGRRFCNLRLFRIWEDLLHGLKLFLGHLDVLWKSKCLEV